MSGIACAGCRRAARLLALSLCLSLGAVPRANAEDLGVRASGVVPAGSARYVLGRDISPLASTLRRAERRLEAAFTRAAITFPPRSVTLIGLKREGRLEMWVRSGGEAPWAFVRSYLVRATSGRLGPKLGQGDHQVPEGLYRVTALNPNSKFHLSLRLDYPSLFDRAKGEAEGRHRLGGDIMIHGGADSDGCLAVGDEAAEDLFALATRVGTENVSVIVSPVDLRNVDVPKAVSLAARPSPWLTELYTSIDGALDRFPVPLSAPRVYAPAKLTLERPRCKAFDARDCERRCLSGDAASCAGTGVMYRDGRGVPANDAHAWIFLSRACTAGNALGCSELGRLYLRDNGPRRDVGLAADLARAACQAGDGHGCNYLAEMCAARIVYSDLAFTCDSASIDRLRNRAVALLVSDCKGWGAYDCATLAAIYAEGDSATALRFAAGSCSGGDPGGCYALAQLTEAGADPSRASDLYRRACRAGFASAC